MKYRNIITIALAAIICGQLSAANQTDNLLAINNELGSDVSKLKYRLSAYKEKLLNKNSLKKRAPRLGYQDKKKCEEVMELAIKLISEGNTNFFPYIQETNINISKTSRKYSEGFIREIAKQKFGGISKSDWHNFTEYTKKRKRNERISSGKCAKRRKKMNSKKHNILSDQTLDKIYQDNFLHSPSSKKTRKSTVSPIKFNVKKRSKLSEVEMALPTSIVIDRGIKNTINSLVKNGRPPKVDIHHLKQHNYDKFMVIEAPTHKYFYKPLHNMNNNKVGSKVNRSEFNKMVGRLGKAMGVKLALQTLEYMTNPCNSNITSIIQVLYLTYGSNLIIKQDVNMEDVAKKAKPEALKKIAPKSHTRLRTIRIRLKKRGKYVKSKKPSHI